MSMLKPLLWLPFIKVEAQQVTARHKKECCVCGGLPQGRRLLVRVGAARAQKTLVFCPTDGVNFVLRRIEEAHRLVYYLMSGNPEICVRGIPVPGDPHFRPKKTEEPKPAKAKPVGLAAIVGRNNGAA